MTNPSVHRVLPCPLLCYEPTLISSGSSKRSAGPEPVFCWLRSISRHMLSRADEPQSHIPPPLPCQSVRVAVKFLPAGRRYDKILDRAAGGMRSHVRRAEMPRQPVPRGAQPKDEALLPRNPHSGALFIPIPLARARERASRVPYQSWRIEKRARTSMYGGTLIT
jgi:hypothetical protein